MTASERRERADRLMQRFASDVAAETLAGVGAWPEAWAIAAPATDALGARLLEWEVSGRDELVGEIDALYRDALAAWQRASTAFLHRPEARR